MIVVSELTDSSSGACPLRVRAVLIESFLLFFPVLLHYLVLSFSTPADPALLSRVVPMFFGMVPLFLPVPPSASVPFFFFFYVFGIHPVSFPHLSALYQLWRYFFWSPCTQPSPYTQLFLMEQRFPPFPLSMAPQTQFLFIPLFLIFAFFFRASFFFFLVPCRILPPV